MTKLECRMANEWRSLKSQSSFCSLPSVELNWPLASEFLTAHDTDEERDYESQTADNQISLLISRLCTRYSAGLWSAVSGLSDFVSFVAFCKKSFCAPRASRLRLRQTASSPRRPDEERSRHFTLARKNAAPLARRRVDWTCLLATGSYLPPPNLTVTRLEQFPVPATHTWYV